MGFWWFWFFSGLKTKGLFLIFLLPGPLCVILTLRLSHIHLLLGFTPQVTGSQPPCVARWSVCLGLWPLQLALTQLWLASFRTPLTGTWPSTNHKTILPDFLSLLAGFEITLVGSLTSLSDLQTTKCLSHAYCLRTIGILPTLQDFVPYCCFIPLWWQTYVKCKAEELLVFCFCLTISSFFFNLFFHQFLHSFVCFFI